MFHCELCNVELQSLKQRADHDMSALHQANKRKALDQNARFNSNLAFNKPIFTEEFLTYNKGKPISVWIPISSFSHLLPPE